MNTRESESPEPFSWPASSPAAPDLSSLRAPIVAIDPGISGAVVMLRRGVLRAWRDFKGHADIARAVKAAICAAFVYPDMPGKPPTPRVVMEFVHAMPGEGVCSVFTFGKSAGVALGSAVAWGYPPEEVAPQRWQNYFRRLFALDPKRKFKEMTRAVALRLFPKQPELFKRKKDHGTADAALLAAYALQAGNGAADKPNVVG